MDSTHGRDSLERFPRVVARQPILVLPVGQGRVPMCVANRRANHPEIGRAQGLLSSARCRQIAEALSGTEPDWVGSSGQTRVLECGRGERESVERKTRRTLTAISACREALRPFSARFYKFRHANKKISTLHSQPFTDITLYLPRSTNLSSK